MGSILAKRLISCRREKHLSQADLSEMTGIGRDRISKIETGDLQVLKEQEAETLAKVFGLDKSYFIEEDDVKRNSIGSESNMKSDSTSQKPEQKSDHDKDVYIKDLKVKISEMKVIIKQLQEEKDKLKEIIRKIAMKQLVQGDNDWREILKDLML